MDRILAASYGDKRQGELNRKPVDHHAAARIEAGYKARRASMGPREAPTPQQRGASILWDEKYHGVAYGGHRNPPSPDRKPVKVEIRPGVLHTVEVVTPGGSGRGQQQQAGGRPVSAPHARPSSLHPPHQSPAGGGGPGRSPGGQRVQSARPSTYYAQAGLGVASPGAPPGRSGGGISSPYQQQQQQGRASLKPHELDTLELAPVLAQIEEDMRAALRSRSAMHVPERVVLLRAIGKVLGKKDIELGVKDRMSVDQFAAAWSSLGVSISPGYVSALFNKYGHNVRGNMPVMVFVEALLYGAPRQLMLENDYVQRGPYLAGKPATHMGKIQYRECKKGVWPPSDWDPALAARSSQLPDSRLTLEFVYGYDGFQATSPNIFYTGTGEVVYHAAGVGIVYDKTTHTQRFFLGHDDDILCLAIHPDRRRVATGQVGKDPAVIVWDTVTCKAVQKINQGYGNRGVQAACFSSSGTKLAVVCTDNSHTLYIWDWARKQCLLERKTQPGAPPTTYGVVWSPFEPDRLLTYGQNYIKFYELQRPADKAAEAAGAPWGAKQDAGVFAIGKTFTIFSACFLPSGVVLAGNAAGSICSWKGTRLLKETPGHAPGPLMRRPDGIESYGGVRCLVLHHDILLSGGADGYVIKWDVSKGDLGPPLQRLPLLRPDQMGSVRPPCIRGLDCFPGSQVLIAGTGSCDIWEVDDTPEILVQGQEGDLWGLAMNPAYPHVFATTCDSEAVVVWSAATRKPIRVIQMAQNGDKARSAAFSPSGEHLAVGMYSGGLKVLEFHPALAQVYWGKLFAECVDEVKYSPCGRYLAAGSHDQNLDVFDVKSGYRRIARCVGHSSTVTHLDWSADSSVIQSNDQAYEVLYFDPRSGRQIKENQRDTQWSTWTCVLGFPVMGIWPPESDGTDVNSCDRSPSGRYLLTADDFGKVSLLNYPCVVAHAPALRYGGHSSHVMNVRWAADESYAISVGGRDRCIFQWRLVPLTKEPSEWHGSAPLHPLDQQGLIYRLPDGMPGPAASQQHQQQQQQQQRDPYQTASPWGKGLPEQAGRVTGRAGQQGVPGSRQQAPGGQGGRAVLGGGGYGVASGAAAGRAR